MPLDAWADNDWESLRVAIRIVYETEDLGVRLGRRLTQDRDVAISEWSDSLESALSFMSWVRAMRTIVNGVKYSTGLPATVAALWRRHGRLASKLLESRMTPARRISILVELGGIELCLWGHTWALEPMRLRTAETTVRRLLRKAKQNRHK